MRNPLSRTNFDTDSVSEVSREFIAKFTNVILKTRIFIVLYFITKTVLNCLGLTFTNIRIKTTSYASSNKVDVRGRRTGRKNPAECCMRN